MHRRLDPASTTILIVNDMSENLEVLDGLLRTAGYRVKAAKNGVAALRLASDRDAPSLILLDVMMPGMDGYTVLERLQNDPATCDIPVIFVTALTEAGDEEAGLAMGAADYISKPIKPAVLLARVRTHLQAKLARDLMRDHNACLEAEVSRRMEENEQIQAVSIRALANLAETRDHETGRHIRRTQAYVRVLAEALADDPRFAPVLTPAWIDLLTRSAPLHDIGKVGIPDHILQKRGKLDADEWAVMKTHAEMGARAIEFAERDEVKPAAFLALARDIAHWHHEHWDGSGYPDGLAGEAIPLAARLMTVADVFDAMMSRRVYKSPFPADEVRAHIVERRGTHFDPDVVNVFIERYSDFIDIARRHADPT
ncbi:HD-GYP domain-containing protein [Methyloversatilis sp.]|uniref:HD-GYP domain-containing protein n=1 Tax=Methyloversatilis sp. TaxID=2569862 RepID=UPI003D28E6D2